MARAVILGRNSREAEPEPVSPTLDALFRRAAAKRPEALALIDPPNRADVTGGTPRRLSYAQADHAIAAMAAQLRALGLQVDDLVGLQMPNTVESMLALLAIGRAGLIAVPLPLLWRRADAANALRRLSVKAMIAATRAGTTDHAALAMAIAADVFPIKHVLGFGAAPPDGMIALDESSADAVPAEAPYDRGEHVAAVTWDVAPDGLVPVARSHAELIAGGIAAIRAGAIGAEAAILTSIMSGSFAGIATGLVPWLITGGRLHLHHPYDAAVFADQIDVEACDTVVVPGAMAAMLAEAGLPSRVESMLALWRSPERQQHAPPWRSQSCLLADIRSFGETGFVAARRTADGKPVRTIPEGTEAKQTGAGTIALRGPMVPRHPFPPGSENLPLPHIEAAADGFVNTGYTSRRDAASEELTVTGPPPGLVHVGGYRFAALALQDIVSKADSLATIAALPDALAGHRLAGAAPDAAAVQQELEETGINPLISVAFQPRRKTG